MNTGDDRLELPNVYNKHLPYDIQDESKHQLSEIKYNLARAIICQEFTPGISRWCTRLRNYIQFYGHDFSKEDHVLLIKLMYSLVTMPGLETKFVKDFIGCLYQLLRKKELLSRDDLTLPWRPLYELVKSIRKIEEQGFEKLPDVLIHYFPYLINVTRNYFPVASIEEMLLEFRPLMCPLVPESKSEAAYYLSNFLPTRLPPAINNQGYQLWLDELMVYRFNCVNIDEYGDLTYLRLFARLASHNTGYINWVPYATKIFDHIVSDLSISLNPEPILFAKWVVYMIGGDQSDVIFEHLEKLFIASKSFYHPSNYGEHSETLLTFLDGLVSYFKKRLSYERHRQPSWELQTRNDAKLKDSEIERFVLIVRDAAFLTIYGKSGKKEVASIFHNLALIRSDLVLPRLLERTYEALQTLVEPHQVTATLSCITSVARVLVTGGVHMPSAPTNILPLLRLVLPGIDPNDLDKTICAFQFISAITTFVPLVDCTLAMNGGIEMTYIEKVLCEESGQFEDVVLQFVDRCFILIENSATEKIYGHESHHSIGTDDHLWNLSRCLVAAVRKVFQQCSNNIFQSVLDCLFVFVSTRVLEVDFAGKMVSVMCQEAATARPEITLKKFLPYITNCVTNLAEVDGIEHDEHTDAELLWYLEMLNGLVECNGKCLLLYKNNLTKVLQLTLHLKCKNARLISVKILQSILSSLTKIYPLEWRSISESYDLSPLEHFYIRDWGKHGDINNLNVQWHTSSNDELKFVNEILDGFMSPELDELQKITEGKKPYIRENVHKHLQILAVCLKGCETILPMWNDKNVEDLESHTFVLGERSLRKILPDEMKWNSCITRKYVADITHKFFNFMRSEHEDDAISFSMISVVYEILMLQKGFSEDDYLEKKDDILMLKEHLKDKLHGKRRNARCFYIERLEIQHGLRVLDNQTKDLTYADKTLLDDLLLMTTSDYTQVRIDSQHTLDRCMCRFNTASRYILPTLLKDMQPKSLVSHEKLKGILHVLSHSTMLDFITHYWEIMCISWPMIAQANQSEKPSVILLSENLISEIKENYSTLKITSKIDKKSIALATELLHLCKSIEEYVIPSEEIIKEAEKHFAEKYEKNEKYCYKLEEELCRCINDRSTHWRSAVKCMQLLYLLRNNERKYSPVTVETCVKLLINDSLELRKKAVRLLIVVLHQRKPQFKKILLDYSKFALKPTKEVLLSLQPGDNRPDNEWLQYQESDPIKSQEDLNNFSFVEKTHWGYQTWPKELKVYSHEQDFYTNMQNRTRQELCNTVILDAFMNIEYLEKIVKYFSIEKNGFSDYHFRLFKSIFRNYGSVIFNHFKKIIEELLAEQSSDKSKGKQCLAAEIIGGMVRGSKHWNFNDLTTMWNFLIPLLKDLLDSNKIEKYHDWKLTLNYATKSLDPNRFHQLVEMLTNNPLSTKGGSQGDVQRLEILIDIIKENQWRLGKKYHDLLHYLLPHLSHSFQNVREVIGRLLAFMFESDLKCGNYYTPSRAPSLKLLIDHIVKDISMSCRTELDENSNENFRSAKENANLENQYNIKREERDLLLKTVLHFLGYNSDIATSYSSCKDIYQIIPLIMPMTSREDDPEIVALCKETFSDLAQKILPEDSVEFAVSSVIQVCHHKSWKARAIAISYLQLMVFYNRFAMDTQPIKDEMRKVLIERLKDVQIEVREKASELFSGLVHYGYFAVTPELLKMFYDMAETKYRKDSNGKKTLQIKHGGVLGLSGIILAFPYDVETWMPEVIINLGNYLHGVHQIVSTAKATLSEFKRTHQDNWHLHRQKFTEDQLTTLTDLLISPSYYA